MPLKVLIIPDKFKGTLTAKAAAEAIARGWRSARPKDSLDLLPMSDGGDGFGDVIGESVHAKIQTLTTVDAAHRTCAAQWWWETNTRTAIIESARVVGLALLPPKKFHPFQLDTFGLGALFQAAAEKGAKRCLVGIGGSATNDGGFGAARALGWKFYDGHGQLITEWTRLDSLTDLRPPPRTRWFQDLLVAVDVQNPLLGPHGCTRVYGPQKGLKPKDISVAERCLKQLAKVVEEKLNRDCASKPGSGAAGGLGFGLRCLLGAHLEPGFDLFARYGGLANRLRAADLVVTGEGAIDEQTLMGKGVGEIAHRCRRFNIPCIGLAGAINAVRRAQEVFTKARALTELTSVKNAKSKPEFWLERLAMRVAAEQASALASTRPKSLKSNFAPLTSGA